MEIHDGRIIVQGEEFYSKLSQKWGRQPLSDEFGSGHLSPNITDYVQGFDRLHNYISCSKPISHAEMIETPDHILHFWKTMSQECFDISHTLAWAAGQRPSTALNSLFILV